MDALIEAIENFNDNNGVGVEVSMEEDKERLIRILYLLPLVRKHAEKRLARLIK